MAAPSDPRPTAQVLGPILGVVAIATAALVIGPFLVAAGYDYVPGELDSLETLVRVGTVPAALFTAVVLVGVAALGSWKTIWFEDLPAASWVRGVAVAVIVAALIGIDYGNLADAGLATSLVLLFTSLLRSAGSELLFRGLAIDLLRARGLDELRVGIVSATAYGLLHLLTVLAEGPNTVIQVVVMSLLGGVFYGLRRASGSLAVPIAAHALIDLGFSSTRLGGRPGAGLVAGVATFALALLAIAVIVHWREMEVSDDVGRTSAGSRRNSVRFGLAWVGRAGVALVAFFALAAVVPFSSGDLSSEPAPSAGFDDAMARFGEIATEEDASMVYEPCRSQVFEDGSRSEVAVVLFHGLTNCPQQFVEFGRRLHADGVNVVILRAPRHGLAADDDAETIGGVGLVGELSARDLRDWADDSIDIANGLGEQVHVMGLSMGGAVSMWSGQFRSDVDRVVAVAPGISIPVGPRLLTTGFVNAFNRLPNLSVPTGGDQLDHAYYGGSTGALASLLLLARATESDIGRRPAAATEVIVVLNPNDDQVDNDDVRQIVERWTDGDGAVDIVLLPDVGLPHDLIDPDAPGGDIELVYPFLLDILLQSQV